MNAPAGILDPRRSWRRSLQYGALVKRLLPFMIPFYLSFALLAIPNQQIFVNAALTWSCGIAGTALFVLVSVIPWDQLPGWLDASGPMAFFLVVGLLRHATGGSRASVTVLFFMPIIWLALRGTRRQLVLGIGVLAFVFILPVILIGEPKYPPNGIAQGILWPLVFGVVAFAAQELVFAERARVDDLESLQLAQRSLTADLQSASIGLDSERELMRVVLDNLDIGVVACDSSGRFTISNRVVQGLSKVGLPGGPTTIHNVVLPIFELDGVTPVPTERQPLARALKGEVIRNEQRATYLPGRAEPVWLSANAGPLRDPSERITGAVITVQDISSEVSARREIQEARDRLARLLDAVTEQAIVGTDAVGTVTLWNPGAEHLFGIGPAEVIGKKTLASWHDPDQLVARAAELGLPVADPANPGPEPLVAGVRGGTSETREWALTRPDGSRLEASMSVTAVRDGAGEVTGFLGVISDVTALRAGERLKDQFIAMVSHELRTPLSSIIGYLEVILDDPDAERFTDEQSRYLAVVDRNARRLLRLVGDLLFAAQVGAGSVSVRRTSADLATILQEAVDSVAPKARGAKVELLLDIAAELPPWPIDPDRIGQAVDNIIGNAVKFTPAGGSVSVRLSGVRDAAVIEVTDTGPGIAAADRASIFEAFYRAQAATQAAVPGVGLGLAISRAIADAHGGRLELADTGSHGTTFRLTLPAEVQSALSSA
ncbi:MAG: PAS domain-containing sensor histidine kinase [Jatrophihabitans sp.]